jgi:hypothetical protein
MDCYVITVTTESESERASNAPPTAGDKRDRT